MSRGRVIVIDDDPAVLASLEAMLDVAGFEVELYRSPGGFLTALEAGLAPGCVVTDVRMPEISGLALVERLKAGGRRDWPVVVISGHADVPLAVAAMKAGASTVLEKPLSPAVLVEAIVAAGAACEARPAAPGEADEAARLRLLSRREAEVLSHLVKGASSKATALTLGISPRTIDVFRANILRKTRAPNIAALATLVARAGRFPD